MTRTKSILAGYVAGLATAGVIAILVSMASPKELLVHSAPFSASPSKANPSVVVPQHSEIPLDPEIKGRTDALESRILANSNDLASRKQLAILLLQNEQLMGAFDHASVILETEPDDPDGLYVHGVVRLAMGQVPKALQLFDQILELYPEHSLALRAKAKAQRKIGDLKGAEISENRANQALNLPAAAADGSLMKMLRSQQSGSSSAQVENLQ